MIRTMTNGRFLDRVTGDGAASSFEVDGRMFTIQRGDAKQVIDCDTGMGAMALCRTDGSVLGYGTVEIEDLEDLANSIDREWGARNPAGSPLARILTHGIVVVAPLDDVPAKIRDLFLEPVAPVDVVMALALSDDLIRHAMDEGRRQRDHDHGKDHDHDGHGAATPDTMDATRARIDGFIRDIGHAVITIAPDENGDTRSYTVGLAENGWPELVLSNLGMQGQTILNAVVTWLRSKERRPTHGLLITQAMSVPLRLRRIDNVEGLARVASERLKRTGSALPFELMQVMWPDEQGRFADERGYDERRLPQHVL